MRRPITFVLLLVPSLVWVVLSRYAQTSLERWSPEAGDMTPMESFAITANNRIFRGLGFVAIALFLLGPLMSLGIAWLAGALRPRNGIASDVLGWWAVSVVSFGIVLRAFEPTTPDSFWLAAHSIAVIALLSWAAFVALSISLGSAYALQAQRVARGDSRMKPARVFHFAAPFFYCLGFPTLCVPLAFWGLDRFDQARRKAQQ